MSKDSREATMLTVVAAVALVAMAVLVVRPLQFEDSSYSGLAAGTSVGATRASQAQQVQTSSAAAGDRVRLPDQALELPDLIVRQLEVWPASPLVGQETTVTFLIVNRGRAAADVIEYSFFDAGASSLHSSPLDTCDQVLELAPGESCRVARYLVWEGTGSKRFGVVLDPDNLLRETIETNNERQRLVMVREIRTERDFSLVERSSDRRFSEGRRGPGLASVPWSPCSEPRPEFCTLEYLPVCAVSSSGDKMTFSNSCLACADARTERYRAGACGEDEGGLWPPIDSGDSEVPGDSDSDNGDSPVACTADAMLCSDGSFVSRVPPSCEFAPCPGGVDSVVDCPDDVAACLDGSFVSRVPPLCEFPPCAIGDPLDSFDGSAGSSDSSDSSSGGDSSDTLWGGNCDLIPDKLEACEPFSCEFPHPFAPEIMIEMSILGLQDELCIYFEGVREIAWMDCAYPEDLRKAVAQYYRDVASAESYSTSARIGADGTVITYIIDGEEVENPSQFALESGVCVFSNQY